MFKRSFRSQEPSRVDKATRLMKKTTGSSRDAQKLAKLERSFTEDKTPPPPPPVSRHNHHHNNHHGNNNNGGHGLHRSNSRSAAAAAQQQQQAQPPPPPASSGGIGNGIGIGGSNLKAANQKPLAPSPIVTLTVGREGRLFAAHEDVLRQAPFFEAACRDRHFFDVQSKRISLPDEEPEVFSAVLEYLYKGDYYPRLVHNRQRNSWELEDAAVVRNTPNTSPYLDQYNPNTNPNQHHNLNNPNNNHLNGASPRTGTTTGTTPSTASDATVYVSSIGEHILRDTVVYCAAERYGLEELKRVALRKQGLQAGIDVGTILRSAQYAYAHTPDTDSRLRAHYLALIIRCRKTFKRSGTMQAEMERGGSKLFFDLFVAMCNHLDDVIDVSNARTPKTV